MQVDTLPKVCYAVTVKEKNPMAAYAMLHVHAMVSMQGKVIDEEPEDEDELLEALEEADEILTVLPDSYFCFQFVLCMN